MAKKPQPIEQLFDPAFAKKYIAEHAPKFATAHDLSDLAATPIKRNIGDGFYHVVIRYDSASLANEPVFCSAHSKENRELAYRALQFIRAHGFKNHKAFLPTPLFFEKNFRAFFYQGMEGKPLLYYIQNPAADFSAHLEQAACWLAELHSINTEDAENFNPETSRIKTVLPGPGHFLPKIQRLFPKYYDTINNSFNAFVAREEKTIASLPRLYVIHGDFHPENVIINTANGNISVIDFTDICISDWARDVGSFMQQLAFMSAGYRSPDEIQNNQEAFVRAYCRMRSISHNDADVKNRIFLYQSWTALRSAIYFLTKLPAEPKEAEAALNMLTHLNAI